MRITAQTPREPANDNPDTWRALSDHVDALIEDLDVKNARVEKSLGSRKK